MLCAGFSLRPFVASFLFKSEMLERDHYFSCLAWPLPPLESFSPCTGSVCLTQCCVQIKFKRKLEFLEKKVGIWNETCPRTDSLNLWNMSCPSLEVLWGIRCQSYTHCLRLRWFWNSKLGQTLPWDVNYPMGHFSYPLCSKRFTQLQLLISREVICGYNLDCPANCWMPEEAGGECAAAGCVGFSFWFTVRTGGWVLKTLWDPDTICCSIGCVWAAFRAGRSPLAFWNSCGS